MKPYEIFAPHFSVVIEAFSIDEAIKKFQARYKEEIILIVNAEHALYAEIFH